MTVVPSQALDSPTLDIADAPVRAVPSADDAVFGGLMSSLGKAGTALQRADTAEKAFASGHGGVQEMVFERARADAILEIATGAASKTTQSLNTILNMQV